MELKVENVTENCDISVTDESIGRCERRTARAKKQSHKHHEHPPVKSTRKIENPRANKLKKPKMQKNKNKRARTNGKTEGELK